MAGMGSANRMVQAAFRVRNDDGVESLSEANGGATQIGADNTNWDQVAGEAFRLRVLCTHANTGTTFYGYITLYYSKNGGAYTWIDEESANVRSKLTSYWTNMDNPTEFAGRLGSGTWYNNTQPSWGGLVDYADYDTDQAVSYFACNAGDERELEVEWCLELVEEDLSPGDTIEFRMYDQFGNIFSDGYTFTPMATVADAYVAPSITNTPATDHEAESDYAETMTASDGTAPLVWSLDAAPTGATINSSTGVIAWTPSEDIVGTVVDFTARVTDAVAGTDTLAWQVTVTDVQLTGRPEMEPALGGRTRMEAAMGGKVEM